MSKPWIGNEIVKKIVVWIKKEKKVLQNTVQHFLLYCLQLNANGNKLVARHLFKFCYKVNQNFFVIKLSFNTSQFEWHVSLVIKKTIPASDLNSKIM